MGSESVGARDLAKCFGNHRQQTVAYALEHCLQCRKLKACVRKSWGADRHRQWRRDDWWELRSESPRAGRRPPWPSTPPAGT